MQKIFFTSDTHFGHEAGLDIFPRDFQSIGEHDEYLVDRINSTVGKRDYLYHLGDFCWGDTDRKKIVFSQKLLDKIRCKNIHLIMGNHDPRGKDCKPKEEFAKLFASCYSYRVIKILNNRVVLSHFPIRSWEGMHRGYYHLYGHSHGTLPENGTLSFDVGVDSIGYVPISAEEVCDRLGSRKIKTVDGHGLVENVKTKGV
jgi:calcineurin-like phosphoesterase family protein